MRFPYFLDSINKKIIILTGYAKPDIYKSTGKIANLIKKKKNTAQSYYDDYKSNNEKAIILPEFYQELINEI
ncbi:hypothetical protein KAI92_00415 [Candidatus Parcubacteria bacterium]|nr:hypothetical protein [Candidatus Parcubacteria bacterium]